ncbi:MAG: hypothetical protein ACJAZ9_001308 [Neolewinella sp.]|jgi:hypothetical protein
MIGTFFQTSSQQPGAGNNGKGPGAASYLLWLASNCSQMGRGVTICCNSLYTVTVRAQAKSMIKRLGFPALGNPEEFLSSGGGGQAVNVFGKYDFSETVGLWLRSGNKPGSNYLSPFISTDSFEFTPEEYLDLRERLDQTIRKYSKLTRVSGGLENLHTGFFRHQSLEESQTFIAQHVEDFQVKARELYRRYLVAINGHARRALFLRRRELDNQWKELNNLQAESAAIANFSGRLARKRQSAFKDQWIEYLKQWNGASGKDVSAPEITDLQAEEEKLQETQDFLSREQAAATMSLSHVTVDARLGEREEFRELGIQLEQLIEEIDEAGLYQLPLGGSSAATASRQMQRLDTVLQQLNNSHRHLPELADFYARRHFWYAQPARLRRLLAPLLELPTEDWETAFASWYFDRCLSRIDAPDGTQLTAKGLAEMLNEIPENQPSKHAKELVFITPGDPVPSGTDLLVDLSGGDRPEGFTGNFRSLRPLNDPEAIHYSLGGVLDSRLLLEQPFVPRNAPDWKLVEVNEAPPGTKDEIAVQAAVDLPWIPLQDLGNKPAVDLKLYLPVQCSSASGAALMERFTTLFATADKVRIFHTWTPNEVTQGLLSDGFNASFLSAALLRAAEATAEPFEPETLMAIGEEIRARCGVNDPVPHPLAERIQSLLAERLPNHFFEVHQPWRGTFLPLVVLSPIGKKTVLLPGGRLPGTANVCSEAERQRELMTAGMSCLEINAVACWENVDGELDRIVEEVNG